MIFFRDFASRDFDVFPHTVCLRKFAGRIAEICKD